MILKEVKRFTNVFLQTITAPMVTTLLFVIVFSVIIMFPTVSSIPIPSELSIKFCCIVIIEPPLIRIFGLKL